MVIPVCFAGSADHVHVPASPAVPERLLLFLLAHKGQAVGALIHSGVALMGANLNLVQRTEVLQVAVVHTLVDSAFDRLVSLIIHRS